MRNLFKYAKAYGGADPQLTDGDVFRIEVSLKAVQVVQAGTGKTVVTTEETGATTEERVGATEEVGGTTEETTAKRQVYAEKMSEYILNLIRVKPLITAKELAQRCSMTEDGMFWTMKQLKAKGMIRRVGPTKGGHWEVVE